MIDNAERIGRFTSSQMSRLMGIGSRQMTAQELADHKAANPKSKARTIKHIDTPDEKFNTYVSEKKRERNLGRSLSLNKGNRSTAWGQVCEAYFQSKDEYFPKTVQAVADKTKIHPTIPWWAGTPDGVTQNAVLDLKSFEPDNFTKLADVLLLKDVAAFKDAYAAEYWQLVSNACIYGKSKAALWLFMPYQSELLQIRDFVYSQDEFDGSQLWKYKYIFDAPDYELPYVPDDCTAYANLITFEFEVPIEDKAALEMRVKMAGEMLNQKA